MKSIVIPSWWFMVSYNFKQIYRNYVGLFDIIWYLLYSIHGADFNCLCNTQIFCLSYNFDFKIKRVINFSTQFIILWIAMMSLRSRILLGRFYIKNNYLWFQFHSSWSNRSLILSGVTCECKLKGTDTFLDVQFDKSYNIIV